MLSTALQAPNLKTRFDSYSDIEIGVLVNENCPWRKKAQSYESRLHHFEVYSRLDKLLFQSAPCGKLFVVAISYGQAATKGCTAY